MKYMYNSRLPAVSLSYNDPGELVHINVPLFTKQYKLVPVKGRWWSGLSWKFTTRSVSRPIIRVRTAPPVSVRVRVRVSVSFSVTLLRIKCAYCSACLPNWRESVVKDRVVNFHDRPVMLCIWKGNCRTGHASQTQWPTYGLNGLTDGHPAYAPVEYDTFNCIKCQNAFYPVWHNSVRMYLSWD